MDIRTKEALAGKEANYLLPFYWQQGNHTEKIPEQVQRIYDSGARAFCVESRPHKDFAGDGWWRDMDIILNEAEKRNMKVWILDDDHFPTGHANGIVAKKYPEMRKWFLVEKHIDVIGPMKDAAVLVKSFEADDILLGAFAYKRTGEGEKIENASIDLTADISASTLYWDVPDGVYRIFFLYKSHVTANDYIDMLRPESVHLMIEAVYEPHYEHYKKYFGNTIAGFFSDEPSFGNDFFAGNQPNMGFYDRSVGMPGLTLPISETLLDMMNETLGFSAISYLPALWYEMTDITPHMRYAYMDAATKLYSSSFVQQLGGWCREHNVEYIGHIIEDNNAHSRLSSSTGHYYRSQKGQDMSGMDIVLHQVIPGFAHFENAAIAAGGVMDTEFFHYVLAKLCASDSHFDPAKHGRAMCEVFGAYGWGEGTQMMKWLMDFLFVRGINHFVPHAFSPTYPNTDCPPHFGAEGHDPQFEGFSELMKYSNKVSHILSDATHIANAAILYHAEGEWMSRNDYMLTQKPAKILYDEHIDYDIVPMDTILMSSVANNKLVINKENYDCLIVPFTHFLPDELLKGLRKLKSAGVPVLFIDALPDNCNFDASIIPLNEIAEYMKNSKMTYIRCDGDCPLLRHYHVKRNNSNIFMFFNESVNKKAKATINLPCSGKYIRLNLLNDCNTRGISDNGKISVELDPYCSEIYIFDDFEDEFLAEFKEPIAWKSQSQLNLKYNVTLAQSDDLTQFKDYCKTTELFNVASATHLPNFSGKIRYSAEFNVEKAENMLLDLGVVGQTASVNVNGIDCGTRICHPYRFDITGAVKIGANSLEIEVSNTLVNKIRDEFSYYLQLAPSGLIGPVSLWRS